MSTWKVGQKCVVVRFSSQPSGVGLAKLRKNTVYTVREVTNYTCVGLRLEEVINPEVKTTHGFMERSYEAEYFRPLVTKTQEEDVRAIKSALRDMPAETRLDRLAELMSENWP